MNRLLFLTIIIAPVLADLVQVQLTVKRGVYDPDGYPRSVILTSMTVTRTSHGKIYPDFIGNPDQPNHLTGTPYYFPGPNLYVLPLDQLEITVNNQLDQIISLHLHGLLQANNSWNDGGYPVTDCGIPPGKNHLYRYSIPMEPGQYDQLFWYHSHDPASIADGLVGTLTIRRQFFSEQVIILQDWLHFPASELLLRLNGPVIQRDDSFNSNKNIKPITPSFSDRMTNRPLYRVHQSKLVKGKAELNRTPLRMVYPFPHTSILINGNGYYNCSNIVLEQQCVEQRKLGLDCLPLNNQSYFGFCQSINPRVYFSKTNTVYLSILNAANNLPLRVWPLYGKMVVLNRDSIDVDQPITVGAITLGVGQRVVIRMVSEEDQVLYVSTNAPLLPGQTPSIWSALLINPTDPTNDQTNWDWPTSPLPFKPDNITDQVEWAFSIPTGAISSPADHNLWLPHGSLSFDPYGYNLSMEYWFTQVGNQLQIYLPQDQLLPKWVVNPVPVPIIDNVEPRGHPSTILTADQAHFRPLNWSLIQGKRYQIVMISFSAQQHPWHLHNHQAEIVFCHKLPVWFLDWFNQANVTTDYWPDFINWVNKRAPLNQYLPVLSLTDSWMVPAYSVVVFRLSASQLGPWLFHCHVDWHLSQGMMILLSVTDSKGNYSSDHMPANYLEHCELGSIVRSNGFKLSVYGWIFVLLAISWVH